MKEKTLVRVTFYNHQIRGCETLDLPAETLWRTDNGGIYGTLPTGDKYMFPKWTYFVHPV